MQIRLFIVSVFIFMHDDMIIQSALVISNSRGLSEIHRDTRTSTYQISRIIEKKNLTAKYLKLIM